MVLYTRCPWRCESNSAARLGRHEWPRSYLLNNILGKSCACQVVPYVIRGAKAWTGRWAIHVRPLVRPVNSLFGTGYPFSCWAMDALTGRWSVRRVVQGCCDRVILPFGCLGCPVWCMDWYPNKRSVLSCLRLAYTHDWLPFTCSMFGCFSSLVYRLWCEDGWF